MTPSYDLQRAMIAVIRADAALITLIGGRVYEIAPAKVTYPYLTIGAGRDVADLAVGIDGVETWPEIHIWSHAGSFSEIAAIDAGLQRAMKALPETLTASRLVLLDFYTSQRLRDPNGTTLHGVCTWHARLEPL